MLVKEAPGISLRWKFLYGASIVRDLQNNLCYRVDSDSVSMQSDYLDTIYQRVRFIISTRKTGTPPNYLA